MTALLPELPRTDEHWVPGIVRDVELTEPLPADIGDGQATTAWLLVRHDSEPIGLAVVDVPAAGLSAAALAAQIQAQVPRAAGRPRTPTYAAGRRAALAHAPFTSVIVCTRERPADLRLCLNSLALQEHPNFEVVVVDNAPATGATRAIADEFDDRLSLKYRVAPRRGLSNARNVALQHADGDLLAWLDDDETADRHWLAEITRAFHERPAVAAVSGLVVPGEMATPAQQWYEAFGGHSKGRGFDAYLFDPQVMTQSPLYPLPPFGVGANMAFRRGVLEAIGGFDPALGAGTKSHGGEDTLAFTEILLSGRSTAYWPGAITRHRHRRGVDELAAQMHGYGIGLTAFYTSLVLRHPRTVPGLVRLARAAWSDVRSPESLRNVGVRQGMPAELMKTNRAGLLRGPAAYLAARRQHRRAAR